MKKISPIQKPLHGEFVAPADKSIGHRAAILSALSFGEASITNFPRAQDCRSTLSALRSLGVEIQESADKVHIQGQGVQGLQSPSQFVDCGNSGTTARFLSGVISSVHGLRATLDGDASLRKRPMARVAKPLQQMGAIFHSSTLPMSIEGRALQAIDWFDEKSSAQVKSAILLAGLSANGVTTYRSALPSRDHTERMLRFLGAHLETQGTTISITPSQLTARDLLIPGDPSGAAFLLGGAVLCKGSVVQAKGVCLNPTRMGLYRVLQTMGADISWQEIQSAAGEPIGTITATHSTLHGLRPSKHEVPSMIDELPLLAVMATQAIGETLVEGAAELRVKESDRIAAICENLSKMGANIEALPDGFRVVGPTLLHGAEINSFDDHRIAMAMSVAALIAVGDSYLDNEEVVGISFPGFFTVLEALIL